jgi:hypothetical protein
MTEWLPCTVPFFLRVGEPTAWIALHQIHDHCWLVDNELELHRPVPRRPVLILCHHGIVILDGDHFDQLWEGRSCVIIARIAQFLPSYLLSSKFAKQRRNSVSISLVKRSQSHTRLASNCSRMLFRNLARSGHADFSSAHRTACSI